MCYALFFHWRVLNVIPDPFFFPDSGAYLKPVFQSLYGLPINSQTTRLLGYPHFLTFLLNFHCGFWSVLLVQHLFVLIYSTVSGWVYYQHFDRSLPRALVVTAMIAALPKHLVYAHAILTETLYTTLQIIVLTLLLHQDRSRKETFVFALIGGFTIFFAFLTRQIGLVLLATALFSAIVSRKKSLGPFKSLAMLSVSIFLVFTSLRVGAIGGSELPSFAANSFFATTFQFVEKQNIDDRQIRDILQPILSKEPSLLADSDWALYNPEGPIKRLQILSRSPPNLAFTLVGIALRAIATHPCRYVTHQARQFWRFIWTSSRRPPYLFSKELTLARGLEIYGNITADLPIARQLVSFKPENGSSYFAKMESIALYPFSLGKENLLFWPWVILVGFIPTVALAGSVALVATEKLRKSTLIVLFLIFAHIGFTNLFSFPDSRYAIPLEPLYVILASAFFACIGRRISENRHSEGDPRSEIKD